MVNGKIFIKTFGCQMNEYDSNRIYDSVSKLGFVKTTNQSNADCYVLNTCHIRDKAKEKVYHEIGRVKKLYRDKKKPIMIIAGCVAQAENEEMVKREPYIDIVLGPQSYHKVNDLLKNHIVSLKQEETEFDTISKFRYFDQIKNNNSKISAFLTIQEGCDKFCHFCVVPYTRGPEYSRPFDKIISEAEQLLENGAKEITLLGQNVNAYSYKKNSKEFRISHLIKYLEQFSELERIRYTTSHPRDMTDDLIDCYSHSKKLMPFVHLPIQTGSNKMLELMNRKHTVDDYLKIYERLKKINLEIEFSSDFIIGYPGETEKDFEDTLNLIKKKGINAPLQVYRALDKLVEIGKIHKIESRNAFIACKNSKCQITKATVFSICENCEDVKEIHDHKLSEHLKHYKDNKGMKYSKYNLEFFGLCKKCTKN